MKSIRMENGVIVYYGNRVGRITGNRAVVDPMFEGSELAGFLEKEQGVREIEWLDGLFDRLNGDPGDTREIQPLKHCRVWQLRPDVDIRMKFIGYAELLRDFGRLDPRNYQQVFAGAVDTNDLEALYAKFNTDHPSAYTGHALSISDVLELYDELSSAFYYVDRIGFQQVDFTPPAQALAPSIQL